MAAGAGRRIGHRPKALLLREGVPLIERTLRLLLDAGVAPVVVVLGHHAALLEPVLARLRARLPDPHALQWATNPAPDEGQGGSLRAGLAVLPTALEGVLVALGDQPLLQAADVAAVLAAWHGRGVGTDLLLPRFEGQPGHPIVFSAAVRAAVMQGCGGAGVREWRRAHPERVQVLRVDHPRHTTDVDTSEDLLTLALKHGVALRWPEPG